MRDYCSKIFVRLLDYYFPFEGEKRSFELRRFKYTVAVTVFLIVLFFVIRGEDTSVLGKSYKPFSESKDSNGEVQISESSSAKGLIDAHEQDSRRRPKGIVRAKGPPLVYNARQVIERQGSDGTLSPLPSGTNFIGKLLGGIDTRTDNQSIRVILPYGASHPSGGAIPRDSILLGSISYAGKSDRVFLRFIRVIFPDGSEYKIDAQALSSADYTPGLVGEVHSQSDMRMIGSLGLTMVSAAADVLTKKSSVSGITALGQVAMEPEPSLKNAALQGVSQTSREEASRHAEVAKNQEEFLTLDSGSDLIVSLLTPFRGEPL